MTVSQERDATEADEDSPTPMRATDAPEEWREQHEPRFRAIVRLLDLPIGRTTNGWGMIHESHDILDVGIHPPVIAARILHSIPRANLTGIGLSDRPVRVGSLDIEVHRCNAERDPWPVDDDSQDRVILAAILEHLTDPLAALAEARRVIRPDGRLVLSTPNGARLHRRLTTLAGETPDDGLVGGSSYHRHRHEFTWREMRALLHATGFEIVREQPVTLPRSGKERLVELAATIGPRSWDDQIVLAAVPVGSKPPVNDDALPYRESVLQRS